MPFHNDFVAVVGIQLHFSCNNCLVSCVYLWVALLFRKRPLVQTTEGFLCRKSALYLSSKFIIFAPFWHFSKFARLMRLLLWELMTWTLSTIFLCSFLFLDGLYFDLYESLYTVISRRSVFFFSCLITNYILQINWSLFLLLFYTRAGAVWLCF